MVVCYPSEQVVALLERPTSCAELAAIGLPGEGRWKPLKTLYDWLLPAISINRFHRFWRRTCVAARLRRRDTEDAVWFASAARQDATSRPSDWHRRVALGPDEFTGRVTGLSNEMVETTLHHSLRHWQRRAGVRGVTPAALAAILVHPPPSSDPMDTMDGPLQTKPKRSDQCHSCFT
jgi:hypothetical protein